MFRAIDPRDVFTPRAASINEGMYIDRQLHQRRFDTAVDSGKSIALYGDSGCGKSWLYKKIFKDRDDYFITIDLAECLSSEDSSTIFRKLMKTPDGWREVEKENKKSGGVSPSGIGISYEKATKFEREYEFDFFEFCEWVRHKAGRKDAWIVFENLEHASQSAKLMLELKSIIMRTDDPNFEKFRIRFCLVGLDSSFEYLSTKNAIDPTISNRLFEVPEIGPMDEEEAIELIHRGFVEKLGYKVHGAAACCKLIMYISGRVPQHLQELCLHVAKWAEEDGQSAIIIELVQEAIFDWIQSFIQHSSKRFEKFVQPGVSHTDRTSQTIFAISRLDKMRFSKREIEAIARREFRRSLAGRKINLTSILRKLSSGDSSLLRHNHDSDTYNLRDIKSRIVLRSCLYKDEAAETVEYIVDTDDERYTGLVAKKHVF